MVLSGVVLKKELEFVPAVLMLAACVAASPLVILGTVLIQACVTVPVVPVTAACVDALLCALGMCACGLGVPYSRLWPLVFAGCGSIAAGVLSALAGVFLVALVSFYSSIFMDQPVASSWAQVG